MNISFLLTRSLLGEMSVLMEQPASSTLGLTDTILRHHGAGSHSIRSRLWIDLTLPSTFATRMTRCLGLKLIAPDGESITLFTNQTIGGNTDH